MDGEGSISHRSSVDSLSLDLTSVSDSDTAERTSQEGGKGKRRGGRVGHLGSAFGTCK